MWTSWFTIFITGCGRVWASNQFNGFLRRDDCNHLSLLLLYWRQGSGGAGGGSGRRILRGADHLSVFPSAENYYILRSIFLVNNVIISGC